MKSTGFARRSVPAIAALTAGLAVAAAAATVHPTTAGAFPSRARDCTACHAAGGSTTATASTTTPQAGSSYTVAVALAGNPAGGTSGYAIVPLTPGTGTTYGGNTSDALGYTATMTAPEAPGTYTYDVFTNQGGTEPDGQASGTQYTITVPAAGTAVTTTTALTMAPSAATATAPAARTLTAVVTGDEAAGTVEFFDGVISLGTSPVLAGSASLSLTGIGVGSYSYHAVFTPTDAEEFTSSTSANVAFTVTAAPVRVTTTTKLSMTPVAATATAPAARTLTATVTGAGAAGTVKFFNRTTLLGTRTIAAGKASLALTGIKVGSYSYHAVFTPTDTSRFTASTSGNVALTVKLKAIIRTMSPTTGKVGRLVTLTGTFGARGVVKFGAKTATIRSWTATKIVVVVPKPTWPSASSRSVTVLVKVTPKGGVTSSGVKFKVTR